MTGGNPEVTSDGSAPNYLSYEVDPEGVMHVKSVERSVSKEEPAQDSTKPRREHWHIFNAKVWE